MRAKMICDEFKGMGTTLMKQARINHDQNVKTSIEPCEEPSKIAECMPKNTKIRYRQPVVQVKNEDVNFLKSLFTRRATKLFMGTKTGPSMGNSSVVSGGLSPKKQDSLSSNSPMGRRIEVPLVFEKEVLSKE
jgi:hypothetical protein